MPHELETQHRLAVLKVLTVATAMGGVVFFVLNTLAGNVVLGMIELLAGFYAAGMYFVVRRTRYLRFWALIFLLPFFTLIVYVVGLPGASESVFVWIFIIPLLSYFLLGRRWGFLLSLVFLSFALLVYTLKQHAIGGPFNPLALANIILSITAIWGFSHVYERSRQSAQGGLLELANTDHLTGLPNRAQLETVFKTELKRASRQGSTLSLALFDLDYFKKINDVYGHDCGDEMLRRVADLFRERLRATDWICRVGGEEFCLILPGAGIEQAAAIAEDIRGRLERLSFVHDGREVATTVSAGVAEFSAATPHLADLYGEADKRLYRAKALGRNRVEAREEVEEVSNAATA